MCEFIYSQHAPTCKTLSHSAFTTTSCVIFAAAKQAPNAKKKTRVEMKKTDTFLQKCNEASGSERVLTLESNNNHCHQKSCKASVSAGSGCSRGKSNTGPRLRLRTGDVLRRRLFSLHTLGTKLASSSRQSDINSPRGVYFCCVVCGRRKKKPPTFFHLKYCSIQAEQLLKGGFWPANGRGFRPGTRSKKHK